MGTSFPSKTEFHLLKIPEEGSGIEKSIATKNDHEKVVFFCQRIVKKDTIFAKRLQLTHDFCQMIMKKSTISAKRSQTDEFFVKRLWYKHDFSRGIIKKMLLPSKNRENDTLFAKKISDVIVMK